MLFRSDILIGTPGFLAATPDYDKTIKNMNTFYKRYFSAKPKFDTFNLHHYPKGGSYMTSIQNSTYKYNFSSEYDIFQTYRNLLNDYGYNDIPIFVTEGGCGMPDKSTGRKDKWNWSDDDDVAILLMERLVLTFMNKKNKNIIGSMISELAGKKNRAIFDYNERTGESTIYKKFYFYKKLIEFIRKYPYHSKHIAGEANSEHYWVEEFKDKDGHKMWMAFFPQ